MIHKIPELPYAYDALEPHIDARTMEIHHTKHHAAYCTKLNEAIKGTKYEAMSLEEILQCGMADLPPAVRNNAGGVANHNFFWKCMKPAAKNARPVGQLAQAIETKFGGFSAFQEKYNHAAETQFGSGWAWLVVQNGELLVVDTPNQNSPLMEHKIPVLGLDVWEHAYYLTYQNKRPDYIKAWWNVVNWENAEECFRNSKQK